ncbi:MAG: hypothetical protein V1827_01465 [Candidatus Micrarchaeota archaeon]
MTIRLNLFKQTKAQLNATDPSVWKRMTDSLAETILGGNFSEKQTESRYMARIRGPGSDQMEINADSLEELARKVRERLDCQKTKAVISQGTEEPVSRFYFLIDAAKRRARLFVERLVPPSEEERSSFGAALDKKKEG